MAASSRLEIALQSLENPTDPTESALPVVESSPLIKINRVRTLLAQTQQGDIPLWILSNAIAIIWGESESYWPLQARADFQALIKPWRAGRI